MSKLKSLEQALGDSRSNAESTHPPVHLWKPKHIGEIDITILSDGSWLHEGSPINRQSLVRLFSSVLWKEEGQNFLKTPAEQLQITVESTPFLMVDLQVTNPGEDSQQITLRSSYGDSIVLGEEHPIVMNTELSPDQSIPTVHVRYGMLGRLTRSVFLELIDYGELLKSDDTELLRLRSNGADIDLPIQAV